MRALSQAVNDFVPAFRKRADGAEKACALPAETLADLREIGIPRAFVPRVYGGDERSLSEVLQAMTTIATACASTAWVGSLFAIHNMAACWLEKQGQEEIFLEGPDVLMSSSVAPTGALERATGGFRLAGRWWFSSGVDHASWIMLGARLRSAESFLCFVRASEATLIDDWRVSGLRATGSKSVEVRDVFIPNCRALLLQAVTEGTAPGLSVHPSSFYRLPWKQVFDSAFPPAALGTAIAALQGFREYTASRVSRFSGREFRTNAGSGMRMAEAAAQIDAARLLHERDLAVLDRLASDGDPPQAGAIERMSYDAAFITHACSRAVLQIFLGSGGSALYEGHPLQRHFRDIHAMTQHAALDMDAGGETYGQALFRNPALCLGATRTSAVCSA